MSDFIKTQELEMKIKIWSGRKGLKSVLPTDTLRYLVLDNDVFCERLGWTGRLRDEMKGWLIDEGQLEAGMSSQCPCTSMVYSMQKVFDDQSPDSIFDFRLLIVGLIESYATRPLFRDFDINANDIMRLQPIYMTFDEFEEEPGYNFDIDPATFEAIILHKAANDKIPCVNFYHILKYIYGTDAVCEKFGWTHEFTSGTKELVQWRANVEAGTGNPGDPPVFDSKVKAALAAQHAAAEKFPPRAYPFNFAAFIIYFCENFNEIKTFLRNLNLSFMYLTETSHVYTTPAAFVEPDANDPEQRQYRAVELPKFTRKEFPSLDTLGVLLTHPKKHNDDFPITGRDSEIEEAIECLLRMQKNSFILVGEPGVGKSAVAYELARRIVKGTVPPMLQGRHIVEIRLLDIISGAKSPEEAAKLFKSTLDEAAFGNIIIFIDEIHTLVTEKTLDAANILKPYLTDSKGVSVIGATTNNEYSKYIRRDGALNRRFTPLRVGEPNKAAVTAILTKSREGYERHYGMKISDDAIDAVAEYSRLIMDKNNPDKSLELLEGTCARVIAETTMNYRPTDTPLPPYTIERVDIARKVCQILGLPLNFLISEGDATDMLKSLSGMIFGQQEAVTAVANQLANAFTLHTEGKPLVGFLFAGPTGVGKSELSAAIADTVLGGRDEHLIILDMAEFTEKTSVAKLIGSPPGMGDLDAIDFVDEFQKKPPSVIVVDGVENAHHDVLKIFSKILEEGKLQNTKERTVTFEKTILVFTSNYGFDARNMLENKDATERMEPLKQKIGADFLNRLDDVLVFNLLDTESLMRIAKLEISRMSQKFASRNCEIVVDSRLYIQMANLAQRSGSTDARIIKSCVKRDITSGVREIIVANAALKNKKVFIGVNDAGQITFSL